MINSDPKVSVIIATHNHAHFLPECLTSVKTQSYKNYEVIVVDNGSTDSTQKVIHDLAWEKLRYHYQEDTGSVAGPRNTGSRLAKGEYLAFLDSDDLWYTQKLKRVMQILEIQPEIDIISHSLQMIKNGKKIAVLKSGPLRKDMFKLLLCGNRLLGSATVVKKSVLFEVGGFDERKDFVHAEDYETWLKIAYLKKRFYFINEILGAYRLHDYNLSYDFERVRMNEINVINEYFKNLKCKIPFYKTFLYCVPFSRINYVIGVNYLLRRQYFKGIKKIFLSFVINPIYIPKFVFDVFKKVPAKIFSIGPSAFESKKANLIFNKKSTCNHR